MTYSTDKEIVPMEGKLYYGIGRRCINPKVPVSLAGYFNVRMWESVADDIEVRALVLRQGGKYSSGTKRLLRNIL